MSSRCSSRRARPIPAARPRADGDHQVERQVRLEREFGHLGLVDHGNVVHAHPAGHPDFLVALQQAVVELAVGIHLARQQVVLEAAVLAAENGLLAFLQLGRELVFLGQRGLVIGFEGTERPLGLLVDLGLQVLDLGFHLLHLGIARLVGFQALLVVALQLGLARLVFLDQLAVDERMQCGGVAGLGLLIKRLGANPLALHLGQRRREFAQHLRIRAHLFFVRLDDAFLARIGIQLLFRILELHLDLRQTLLQEGSRIRSRLHAPFQIQLDERHRDLVRDARRHLRVGAVEMHAYQLRIAHRRHGQGARQAGHQAGFGWLWRCFFGLFIFLLENVQPAPVFRGGLRRHHQIELLDHALGQCLAFQQFVLRLVEVLAVKVAAIVLCGSSSQHRGLGLLLIDLQRQRRAVDLGHQEGGRHHRHQHDGEAGQHRPPAPQDDVPILAQTVCPGLRHAMRFVDMKRGARQLVGALDQRASVGADWQRRLLACRKDCWKVRSQAESKNVTKDQPVGTQQLAENHWPIVYWPKLMKPRKVSVAPLKKALAADFSTLTVSFPLISGSATVPSRMASRS